MGFPASFSLSAVEQTDARVLSRPSGMRLIASSTAGLLGWRLCDEVPDPWGFVGGTLIIASDLAIAYHERRTSLKRRPTS